MSTLTHQKKAKLDKTEKTILAATIAVVISPVIGLLLLIAGINGFTEPEWVEVTSTVENVQVGSSENTLVLANGDTLTVNVKRNVNVGDSIQYRVLDGEATLNTPLNLATGAGVFLLVMGGGMLFFGFLAYEITK